MKVFSGENSWSMVGRSCTVNGNILVFAAYVCCCCWCCFVLFFFMKKFARMLEIKVYLHVAIHSPRSTFTLVLSQKVHELTFSLHRTGLEPSVWPMEHWLHHVWALPRSHPLSGTDKWMDTWMNTDRTRMDKYLLSLKMDTITCTCTLDYTPHLPFSSLLPSHLPSLLSPSLLSSLLSPPLSPPSSLPLYFPSFFQ